MNRTPLIRSMMTPFPFAIGVEASLEEARLMMEQHGIRHLPVKDGDRLAGLISDRDIKLLQASGDEAERMNVGQSCLSDVFSVEVTTPVQFVAAEMARRRISAALVTKDGRLAGIFTVSDACRSLADLLGAFGPTPPGNDAA